MKTTDPGNDLENGIMVEKVKPGYVPTPDRGQEAPLGSTGFSGQY